MKKNIVSSILFSAILLTACGQEQSVIKLAPAAFEAGLKESSTVTLLDVRTPEEFSEGHLENAINVDWNSADFEKRLEEFDKSTPVFVYCLSGGRSSKAASLLLEKGFTQVSELDGGMMKWRAAGLPEVTTDTPDKTGNTEMTLDEFTVLTTNPEKAVLVDFYADWCAPCKKMEPALNEISSEMQDDVVVIRINADENKTLCKELQVESIPVLLIYKDGELVWRKEGLTAKEEIMQQLK